MWVPFWGRVRGHFEWYDFLMAAQYFQGGKKKADGMEGFWSSSQCQGFAEPTD